MSLPTLDYGQASPRRAGLKWWFFRVGALLVLAHAGLRLFGYLVAGVWLLANNAARGKVGQAFELSFAAAAPFALGAILFLLNDAVGRAPAAGPGDPK
jgi:hypothetical protein